MRFFEEASKCSVCGKHMGYLGARHGFGVRANRHESRCQARIKRKISLANALGLIALPNASDKKESLDQVQETTVDAEVPALASAPEVEEVQVISVDKVQTPYYLKPSVQSWLAPLPCRMQTRDTNINDSLSFLNAIVDKHHMAVVALANEPDTEQACKPVLATIVDDNNMEETSEQIWETKVEEVPKPFYLKPSVCTWLVCKDAGCA
jgi:hypothetical protein